MYLGISYTHVQLIHVFYKNTSGLLTMIIIKMLFYCILVVIKYFVLMKLNWIRLKSDDM